MSRVDADSIEASLYTEIDKLRAQVSELQVERDELIKKLNEREDELFARWTFSADEQIKEHISALTAERNAFREELIATMKLCLRRFGAPQDVEPLAVSYANLVSAIALARK